MKSFGNFHNDVEAVLLSYFHHCALRMSCVDLARAFCFLADKGFCKHSGEQVLNERQTKQVNAIMATSGLYDEPATLPIGSACRARAVSAAVSSR